MCMSMAPRKTNKKEIKPAKQLKSANFPIPQTDEGDTHYSLQPPKEILSNTVQITERYVVFYQGEYHRHLQKE